ncbi:hypothetical protein M0R45_022717 [Rubus argutus]|uniref:Uncharacterized protein n=1 Tax=Rubus argutus TaxID=59490 RepID=A0AAW1XG39_RUBAR
MCSHFTRCSSPSHKTSSKPSKEPRDETYGRGRLQLQSEHLDTEIQRKPGGWKAIPFILGSETIERLAASGFLENFMVYLTREQHLDQVSASNTIFIWSGVSSFAPLLGAFISDTIVFGSFALLLRMATLTPTAWVPQLHPPPCNIKELALGWCIPPNKAQLGFLILGLGFLSIAPGGIKLCNIPFGVDQFHPNADAGKKGIKSFFSWYYATSTIISDSQSCPPLLWFIFKIR